MKKTRQFDARALARSHSFALLTPCIKLCSLSCCILLLSAQCGLIPFFHNIYMPSASHAPLCWLLGPKGPQGESKLCHGDGNSPRSQPPSPTCPSLPYITPTSPAATLSLPPSTRSVWFYPLVSPLTLSFVAFS